MEQKESKVAKVFWASIVVVVGILAALTMIGHNARQSAEATRIASQTPASPALTMMRGVAARALEDSLLEHGIDAHVFPDPDDPQQLAIFGKVDRVIAYHLMTRKLSQSLANFGYTSVRFVSSGDDYYHETYALPPAQHAKPKASKK